MKKSFILIALAFILTACQMTSTPKDKEISITHELGTIQVTTNPEKIAVFDMGLVDTLNELEIKVTAAPLDYLPTQVSKDGITNAGTLFEPDFETLATLDLDLIIISGRMKDQYDALGEIAPVLYLENDATNLIGNLEDKLKTLKELYPNLDYEMKFNQVVKAANTLKDKADSRKTLFLMANGQEIKAFGNGSRYDFVFSQFGFTNVEMDIEASTHGMMLSFEQVQALNPDNIIVMDRGLIVGADTTAQELLDNSMIQSTNAFTSKHIIYVDPNTWYIQEGGLKAILDIIDSLSPLYDM